MFSCFVNCKVRLEGEKENNMKMSGVVAQVGETPHNLKILLGNWVAQWDPQYRAWFYYNIMKGQRSIYSESELFVSY